MHRLRRAHAPAERLDQGPVICAEGYVFELERRGYLQAGALRARGRARASGGRDAAPSRFRARRLGRRRGAHLLRASREAARHRTRAAISSRSTAGRWTIAKEVAAETGALFAGDICNTNVYDPADPASHKAVRAMFEEQVGWAVDAGVDFIVGETFSWAQEALIALDVILKARTDRRHHARDAQGRRHARGLDGRRCLPAPGRRGRARRRPQLHPRSRDDVAAAARDPCPREDASSPRCRCPTARPRASRRSSRCATRTGITPKARGRFPSRSTRSRATATRSRSSRHDAMALDIRYLGVCCGAVPAPHPRAGRGRRQGSRPRASIRRTCRSTRSWARTSASSRCRKTTRASSEGDCADKPRAGQAFFSGRSVSVGRRIPDGAAGTTSEP